MKQKTFPSPHDYEPQEMNILEHGLDMIFNFGVKGFTVEALAKDLVMSKKTVYKIFPTKEILLQKIFRYITSLITEHFKRVLDRDINPLDKFLIATDEMMNRLSRLSPAKISELKSKYPQIWREIEAFRLARREDFLRIFSEAQAQGLVRADVDLELTATLFMNIINDVFQPEFFLRNQLGLREVLLTFRSIFLRGIISESGLNYIKDKL